MFRQNPTYHNIYGFKTIDLIESALLFSHNKVMNYSIGKMLEYALEIEYVDQPIKHLDMIAWHMNRIYSKDLKKEENNLDYDINFFNYIRKIENQNANIYTLVVNILEFNYSVNESTYITLKNDIKVLKQLFV